MAAPVGAPASGREAARAAEVGAEAAGRAADKVMTAAEAVARWVPAAGAVVAVGGMHMHNAPMALVRELIRQRRRVGRLVTSPSAGIQADLLIGAGLVDELLTSYVGFEHLGLAPHFRRAVEAEAVRLAEVDEGFIIHSLYAGAGGLPFIPAPRGVELTDLPAANPGSYRTVVDPFTGRTVTALPPLRPDVALLHCQVADVRGNAAFAGSHFTDRLMAFAARRVVLQVERVVPTAEIARRPAGSTIPGFLVQAVVVAPGGCHPTASHGGYSYDEAHLREYLGASRDAASFQRYLDRYVTGVADEAGYAAAIGPGRLAELGGEGGGGR